MKNILVAIFVSIALWGCATSQQSSSNANTTVADARLKTDVIRMIGIYESAVGGSASPNLVSAKNLGKEGNAYIEEWVVDSNGKNVTYSVKLMPSPRGGVDFAVARVAD